MFSKTHVLLRREFLPHLIALAPSEVKIYVAILIMASPKNGRLTIPLKDLANRTGLSYRITNHAVLRLKEMNHIRYSTDYAMKESHIEVLNYVPVESLINSPGNSETFKKDDSQSQNRSSYESPERSATQQQNGNDDTESHPPNSERPNFSDNSRKQSEVLTEPVTIHPGEKVIPDKEVQAKTTNLYSPGDLIKRKLIETIDREITDGKNSSMIRSLSVNRPIPVIQKALETVRKIPPEKIKRSKLSLFIYFLQHHAEDRQ